MPRNAPTKRKYVKSGKYSANVVKEVEEVEEQYAPTSLAVEVLNDAVLAITGPRQEIYGDPTAMAGSVAVMWTQYLYVKSGDGVTITPTDVHLMLALLKIARAAACPEHTDSYMDGAAYMALAAEAESTF
jgi:hypothetical protein